MEPVVWHESDVDKASQRHEVAMRSGSFAPRPGLRLLRYLVPSLFTILFVYYCNSRLSLDQTGPKYLGSFNPPSPTPWLRPHHHPIDTLMKTAEAQFDTLLSRESDTVEDAARRYRERRGRHPPPGFDAWFAFARHHRAVVVEDFFDQVHHDLEPFWALEPQHIREEARDFEMTIKVRDQVASAQSDWFWTQIWLDLLQTIQHLLPDMDLALNAMDEPRIVVPREDMDAYMAVAARTRVLVDPKQVVNEYQKLPADAPAETRDRQWEKTQPYWKVVSRGCPPDSLARKADIMTSFNETPVIDDDLARPHMYRGYVANYTLSTDVCHQPDLQGLHGLFVEPLSVSATKALFPMFGGSKLGVNNEILLPAPVYWKKDDRFDGGGAHGQAWDRKLDGAIWRGVASGGRNREDNWKAFQRHRFVAMNNGTKISRAEEGTEPPVNFALPDAAYGLRAQADGRLGSWVASWANVSFIDLMCHSKPWAVGDGADGADVSDNNPDGTCAYTSPHFAVTPGVKLTEQFAFKYLPDTDGNSFSGRYLSFLRSSSLPIKATVFREWHDARLVAWKHFVPMDTRYTDWYGIMEYFLGYEGGARGSWVPGHDREAENIARAGRDWAETALRHEDMQVYVLRLLLEYARVSNDKRQTMGWVADLL